MKTCRICLEEDREELIAPCLCKGTSKWIHRTCLDRWRRENRRAYERCNECKALYVIETMPVEVKREIWTMAGFFVCFSLFVGACLCESWECQHTNPIFYALLGATAIFFTAGFIFLLALTLLIFNSNDLLRDTWYMLNTSQIYKWMCTFLGFILIAIVVVDYINTRRGDHSVVKDLSENVLV